MQTINVVKHNGELEPLDLTKPTASLEWATDGLSGVSVSDIMMQSKLHFFDGIATSYITLRLATSRTSLLRLVMI